MPELLTLDFANDWQTLEHGETRNLFEQRVLPAYLSRQRWFASKGTEIERVEIHCRFLLSGRCGTWMLSTFRAHLVGGRSEDYFIPLAIDWEQKYSGTGPVDSAEVLAYVRNGNQFGAIKEALVDARFVADLVRAEGENKALRDSRGTLRFGHTNAYFQLQENDERNIRRLGAEQSNSSILIAGKMIMKAYRKLERGIQPELEMGRYLTDVANYRNTPPLLGSIEQIDADGQPTALAVLQGFVSNRGDGWTFTLAHLKRTFAALTPDGPPEIANQDYASLAERLGIRVAELHQAFAIESGDPAFQPTPIVEADVAEWKSQIQSEAEITFGLLANSESMLPPEQHSRVRALLEQQARILQWITKFKLAPASAIKKTRFHGDLHLGQVLVAGDDFYITDFEGEPARPFAQRRAKHSPLRDVAGMLRSLNYAAWSALFEAAAGETDKLRQLEKPAIEWEREASGAFMQGYKKAIQGCSSCPADPETFARLLNLFILEKGLYEVRYELANRPSWLRIPVEGILSLLSH